MRWSYRIFVVTLVIAAMGSAAAWAGNAHILFGTRNVNNDFAPTDAPDSFGIAAYFEVIDWPVAITFGYQRADDKGSEFDAGLGATVDFKADFAEYYFGMAKIFDKFEHFRPYVGGGLTVTDVEVKSTAAGVTVKLDDRALSPYVNGGAFWIFRDSFILGVDARIVVAAGINDAVVGGSINADYQQISGLVGWIW